MTTWVLLLWLHGMAHSPITVSGIASEDECRRLADAINRRSHGSPYQCLSYAMREK